MILRTWVLPPIRQPNFKATCHTPQDYYITGLEK